MSPYLVFNGNCQEVIDFYERVFDGKNKSIRLYEDYVPETSQTLPDNLSQLVLHGELEINGEKFTFADELALPVVKGTMIYLTLYYPTVEEAKKVSETLVEEYLLPPTETFYSPFHTTLRDKFGIQWNIIVTK